MERFINVYDVDLKGISVFDENLDVLIPLSTVRKALQMTPTADVVPKSEVERLQEAYNNKLAKDIETNADFVKYAKVEVVREIFEDIEIALKKSKKYDFSSGTYFECYLEAYIAELKKKYTK